MLNGRLYRAALVPFLAALAVAAFSLTARPLPLTSTLAPDAFDGARALASLKSLATEFPDRSPGSTGDDALAERVAHMLEGLGGAAGGGFHVRMRHFGAQTIDGQRTLTTVIAQRAGASGGTPIVILAHRDASRARGSEAELSGTAALLELARVFAARETERTIVLVSTSGGSGGDGGAADFVAHEPSGWASIDAAIVLGDVAGAHERKPFVVPYSDGFGGASVVLQRTLASAIMREAGINAGAPSAIGQLAHLAFPFAVGEQGALNAGGLPAVLVQVSGESGPSTLSEREDVSEERLGGFGRAVLSAVDALDTAPDISAAPQTGVVIAPKVIPEWALRLLLAALLTPPLLLITDGYARLRRRRGRSGDRSIRQGLLWTLACALPFFVAAVFARALGWLGALHAAPAIPVPVGALPFDGSAGRAVLAVALALGLSWLAWPTVMRRLGLAMGRDPEAAGLAMLAVLLGVGALTWALNPYAALLVLPALHLWLLLVEPDRLAVGQHSRRSVALTLVALALLPLALLILFYAHELGVGPGGMAWDAVLALAGGHIGIPAAALWSIAFGCVVAAARIAISSSVASSEDGMDGRSPVRIRGPLGYAGPGSLGGTESALRR
jgi:hypothetical protein